VSSSPGSGSPAAPARLGATTSAVRQHNLATLLERLHRRGPASRSELGAGTGISRSTVADLVQELVARGLASEEGNAARSGPGRPSPVVSVRPEGAVVLAAELGVDSITVAAVGLGGTLLGEAQEDVGRARRTPEATLAQVARALRSLAEQVAHGTVAGVGVAVPGLVRRSDGFVHLAPNLGWRDGAVGALLADQMGQPTTPVLVANEADLGALGEHRRGAGQGHDNLVFVSGGVGIGAGLILGGRPMLGSAGYAGEAGHMLVNPSGRPCSCGKVGCWETEAGEATLLGGAGGAVDPAAARWIGVGIGNLVNLLNPDVVVLGGCYGPVFDQLVPHVTQGVASRALGQSRAVAQIVPSALGPAAQLHGAAELCLAETLANPTLRRRG